MIQAVVKIAGGFLWSTQFSDSLKDCGEREELVPLSPEFHSLSLSMRFSN